MSEVTEMKYIYVNTSASIDHVHTQPEENTVCYVRHDHYAYQQIENDILRRELENYRMFVKGVYKNFGKFIKVQEED